jgi:flagellar hook-associated protein 3 FlgL
MNRISTNMPNMDMRYYMQLREWKMNELQNKMASQTRIKNLRDDPIAAGHATRFESKLVRLERFSRNITAIRGEMALVEGNLRSGLDIIQRVRELSVQGANGIYDKSQMAFMGEEVNQLLTEFISLANARAGNGDFLFSGFRAKVEPFRVHSGRVQDGPAGEVISGVEYVGDIGINQAEISEGAEIGYKLPGNHAFWAERQQIYSSVDASAYRVQQDATIRLDGVEIGLKEGDNVHAIISKINDSGAPLKARLDPVKASLVLESTFAHQIWPEDMGNSSVLQDLGIVSPGTSSPPLNTADTASVFGGSIFDMMIHLRNSLYQGDIHAIGGSGLRGIDNAVESLTARLAEIGSRDARLEHTAQRLDYERPEYTRLVSMETDLDLAEAVTNLKMLEYTHKAALATAGRILQPTLLDFLR